MFDTAGDMDNAVTWYNKAADYYRVENSISTGNQCRLKVCLGRSILLLTPVKMWGLTTSAKFENLLLVCLKSELTVSLRCSVEPYHFRQVAQFKAIQGYYGEAIETYENVAEQYLDDPLLKSSSTRFFFVALLCRLARHDPASQVCELLGASSCHFA